MAIPKTPGGLLQFSVGSMDLGISFRAMDLHPVIALDEGTWNVTSGIYQGLAPRFGTAPLPGQLGTEVAADPALPNLHQGETSSAPAAGHGLYGRSRIYGVVPVTVPDPSDITARIQTYAFVLSTDAGASRSLDIFLSSTWNASGYEQAAADFRSGFGTPSNSGSTGGIPSLPALFNDGIMPSAGARTTPQRSWLAETTSSQYWAQIAFVNISGGDYPMRWILGACTADGDATHAPNVNFQRTGITNFNTGTSGIVPCGIPTPYQLQTFKTAQRTLKVYGMSFAAAPNTAYSVSFVPTSAIMQPDPVSIVAQANLVMSATTATKDSGPVTAYTDNDIALVNDPASVSNQSYQAILVAQKRAWACVFQDAYRSENGKHNQWIDLTQQVLAPPTLRSVYSEETIRTQTGFVRWPNFVRGTVMSNTSPVALTAANTGILRKNTVYEFTYALYNKRLNFETNVAIPVKIQTGAVDDFIAIDLSNYGAGVGTAHSLYQDYVLNSNRFIPFPFSDAVDVQGNYGQNTFINFAEYRFYYRVEGSFEWLPALRIDAAELWFRPDSKIYACSGATLGSTGGHPGGFNDYSPLPTDQWIDVQIFKNRAFWFSKKQMIFSLRNNVFSYPGRNSASPKGEFLGAIVHNYPGQAEQSSRLVVYCTDGTYVGRFSGPKQQATLQISADLAATFDVDGSDFVLDPWTSITAFSSRAAVVAAGILFWWGPEGIYRDDGVGTPVKISADIEPDIFEYYDASLDTEIFAHYDESAKEITWFYRPKTADGYPTHGLVYNTLTGAFLPVRYRSAIDWAQRANIKTSIPTAGKRTIVGARVTTAGTIQRPYFYDSRCRAGEMYPTGDFVVKTIATPSTGVRRLTLATGYDATNFATLAVGDMIAIDTPAEYATAITTSDSIVAEITALGVGTIDITLPDGATFDTAETMTKATYLPIWHAVGATSAGLNGIPWTMEFAYWAPTGIATFYRWLMLYLLMRVALWKTDTPPSITVGYKSVTSPGLITDAVNILNNSDGNCQIYHPLGIGDENAEGQAIKLVFSGTHIGHRWVLQYMEAHANTVDGDALQQFESESEG